MGDTGQQQSVTVIAWLCWAVGAALIGLILLTALFGVRSLDWIGLLTGGLIIGTGFIVRTSKRR